MIRDIRNHIIVGVDPGTTKGYAILNLEGRLLKLSSSKHVSYEKLLKEIIFFGNPLIISTDVTPIPKLVKKIAIATGARIISPESSLDTKRKRKLTSPYGRQLTKENLDKHKLDALAAANYAFKKIRGKLEKIRITLDEKNKLHLERDITPLVLAKNMSIHHALQRF